MKVTEERRNQQFRPKKTINGYKGKVETEAREVEGRRRKDEGRGGQGRVGGRGVRRASAEGRAGPRAGDAPGLGSVSENRPEPAEQPDAEATARSRPEPTAESPSPPGPAHPRPPSPNGNVRTSAGRDVTQPSQWLPQRGLTKTCLRHADVTQYVTEAPGRVLPRPSKPAGTARCTSIAGET